MKAGIGFFMILAVIIYSCSKNETNVQDLLIRSVYRTYDTLVRIQSRGSDWTTILFKYDASYRVSEQQTSYLIHGSHGESHLVDYLFLFKCRNGNIDT